jgi:metal-responsive CopG/Arc/MetJ family transcriptional regulator
MKRGASRFTVSVPATLLEVVDQKLVHGEESRSSVVRRLLEEALREIEEREEIERYIRSYRAKAQTEEELGWSAQVVLEHLSELPWE